MTAIKTLYPDFIKLMLISYFNRYTRQSIRADFIKEDISNINAAQKVLIIVDYYSPFALPVNAMVPQKVVCKGKAYILRIMGVIGTIIKIISLSYSDGRYLGDIKIYTIANFGKEALFGIDHIAYAQTNTLGKPAFRKNV